MEAESGRSGCISCDAPDMEKGGCQDTFIIADPGFFSPAALLVRTYSTNGFFSGFPSWQISVQIGWSKGKEKKGCFAGSGISTIHDAKHTFFSACFSVGDNSARGVSCTKNSTNSRKNSTIVLGFQRFFVHSAVGG